MAIEPLYTLEAAAELIPMPSKAALYQFLHRNRDQFPGLYRTIGGPEAPAGGWEQRFLSESEILKIREMTFYGWEDSRYNRPDAAKRGPKLKPRLKTSSPLAHILRRAMA